MLFMSRESHYICYNTLLCVLNKVYKAIRSTYIHSYIPNNLMHWNTLLLRKPCKIVVPIS